MGSNNRARERKWQKNTTGLLCWISHSRAILDEIHVAVAYNMLNRKLTSTAVDTASWSSFEGMLG